MARAFRRTIASRLRSSTTTPCRKIRYASAASVPTVVAFSLTAIARVARESRSALRRHQPLGLRPAAALGT
jgi:hypothetical protein